MKIIILLFSYCLLCTALTGQTTKLDSLELEMEKSDDVSSQTLWIAAKLAYKADANRVKKYTNLLMGKEEIIADSSKLIEVINYRAFSDRKLGNFPESIKNFKIVYTFYKLHQDTLGLAFAADQIGTMNTFLGNMKVAQPYVIETYQLYKLRGKNNQIAASTNGLAIFYDELGDKEKATEKYGEALELYTIINDTLGQANIHANLGLLYIDKNEYELAEYHIKMQGKLDTLLNTQWGLGFHHSFMGYLMLKQGKYQEALASHQRSLAIRLNLDSHYNLAETRSGLASAYFALEEYEQSIVQANLVLIKRDDHKSLIQEQSAYHHLSKAYEGLGQYRKSLEYHKKYKNISDSIYNKNLLEEITEKDAIHERSIQDNEITLLNEKNLAHQELLSIQQKVMIIGSLSFLVLAILLFFLYKLYQALKSHKEVLVKTLSEKNILLREIHHRVKNNLQLISSLLTLQSRTIKDETAIKAITDGRSRVRSMALIHQDLYNKKSLTDINVKDYLEKLCRELFDTYKIDENIVQLELEIDDIDIDIDTLVPLGLIINELITNTLKYAFPNNRNGVLRIDFHQDDKSYKLCIRDNGVGYNKSLVSRESFGSTLVSALTAQLDGHITVDSKEGTMTELIFKRA